MHSVLISKFDRIIVVVAVIIGLVTRVAPLFASPFRALGQFPTEDGYLMMTISRNIARGLGVSVADGLIDTNGVQPLFAFIQAALFRVVGLDKYHGVIAIQVLEIIIAALAAYLVFRLACVWRITGPLSRSRSAVIAAIWFASPVVVQNGMNCLETGLYGLIVLLVMLAWCRLLANQNDYNSVMVLGLGLLSGLGFLVRNDGVFLVVAIALALAWPRFAGAKRWRETAARLCLFGLMTVLFALPWLLYNYLGFGSVIPISATAQAFGANPTVGILVVLSKLMEYMLLVVPVPGDWEMSLPVLLTSGVAVSGLAMFIGNRWELSRRDPGSPAFVFSIYALLILLYYTTQSAAHYFYSRYLFPLSPMLALGTFGMVAAARNQIGRWASFGTWRTGVMLVISVLLAGNLHLYSKGINNDLMPLATWIDRNVAAEQWVGAMQSGTIGYFHDRTVNLDGKVNPQALRALETGTLDSYVINARFGASKEPIQYIVEQAHLGHWAPRSSLAKFFAVAHYSESENIIVLKRRQAERPIR